MTNNNLITTIPTQYHMSKGMKLFGQEGLDAVLAGLKQLHNRMCVAPKDANKMNMDETK